MKFDAVLFDCDGVLVDSEPITIGVLRDMFEEMGWRMSLEEAMGHFLGHPVRDQADLIARHTGVRIDNAWLERFWLLRDAALQAQLQAIEHVPEVLARCAAAFGTRIACASGADLRKVKLQLNKVGLMHHFEGRAFSGFDVPRSKPAPDVYLWAARELGVRPERCAVVEDSPMGARAGVAAGCTVLGYVGANALPGAEEALRKEGVNATFFTMRALPALLGLPNEFSTSAT